MALVLDGTNGLSGVDGSASTPAVQGSDSNTGVFYPAADTVAIGTGGSERMRVDSSGNVGIGTSSPAQKVQIYESKNGDTAVQIYNDNAGASAETNLYVTNGSVANTGLFAGVGGTGFTTASGFVQDGAWIGSGTGASGGLSIMTRANADMRFYTNGHTNERARITSGGYFKASNTGTYQNATDSYHEFYTTTNDRDVLALYSAASNGNQYGLNINTANNQNDATRYFIYCAGGGSQRATIRSNGGLANYSANNVNLASDERLKKDISPLETTWDKVKAIEVVNFRYKDCNEGDPLLYGVIAQQVQPIVPELVVVTQEAKEATEDKEATPEYYGIREQPMYWLAIKALQEAMERIETLEAQNAAFEARLAALEAK